MPRLPCYNSNTVYCLFALFPLPRVFAEALAAETYIYLNYMYIYYIYICVTSSIEQFCVCLHGQTINKPDCLFCWDLDKLQRQTKVAWTGPDGVGLRHVNLGDAANVIQDGTARRIFPWLEGPFLRMLPSCESCGLSLLPRMQPLGSFLYAISWLAGILSERLTANRNKST